MASAWLCTARLGGRGKAFNSLYARGQEEEGGGGDKCFAVHSWLCY